MNAFIAGVLIIGLGAAFLAHFILIAVYGNIQIQEPNPYILYSEIALMILVIAYGVYFTIRSFR